MSETIPPPRYSTRDLTLELAVEYAEELAELASLIPQVTYTPEDILAEQKGERRMGAKWAHGLIRFDDNRPVAFIMGYERTAEGNPQYPENTLYISELAVAETHQGLGMARDLLHSFFEKNNTLGFLELNGTLNYSIQTNSADWNKHVIDLYKSFGFTERALKNYPDRTDVVLGVSASELQLC